MKPLLLLASVLALSLSAQTDLAAREHKGRKGNGKPPGKQAGGVSAAEAAAIARKKTGGRVLKVKPGSKGYRVKVLTPTGEVRYIGIPNR
jgi:hypothetical protein